MAQPNTQIDQFLLEGCMRCSLGATPDCKVLLWTDILEFLRQLILETELQEERKWGGADLYTKWEKCSDVGSV